MDLRPLIHQKLAKHPLSSDQIRAFVSGVISGKIPDYQLSAFLMAIVHVGMNLRETVDLTREMAHQGERLAKPKGNIRVGKHSTGGVGDKTTFLLGPIVASFGLEVSFMSGRGLGHTGGTIDKLSGIVGMKTALTPAEVRRVLKTAGFCIFEQTGKMAPADRRLYALRDLSGTVASIPLIVSSILSKKMAEGLHGLVLDVKYGSGSFMGELKRAKALAKVLLQVAKALDIKATAVLSAMEEPLGKAIGNNLEILECLDTLQGSGPDDLNELTFHLAREMLLIAFPKRNVLSRREFDLFLTSGAGLRHFEHWLRKQGAQLRHRRSLQQAPHRLAIVAPRSGWLASLEARALGELCMELGAGRRHPGESIDPRVGIIVHRKTGERVKKGQTVLEIHHASHQAVKKLLPKIKSVINIAARPKRRVRLIAGVFRNFKD